MAALTGRRLACLNAPAIDHDAWNECENRSHDQGGDEVPTEVERKDRGPSAADREHVVCPRYAGVHSEFSFHSESRLNSAAEHLHVCSKSLELSHFPESIRVRRRTDRQRIGFTGQHRRRPIRKNQNDKEMTSFEMIIRTIACTASVILAFALSRAATAGIATR